MKPYKILLFLLSVFLVFSILSFLLPKEKITISKKLSIKIPDIKQVFEKKQTDYSRISEMLEYQQSEIVTDINSLITDSLKAKDTIPVLGDSLKAEIKKDTSIQKDTAYADIKQIHKPGSITQHIQYPSNDKSVLHSFFTSLSKLKNSGDLIRVLHYGDSQIEGDRITSYIRNELQKQFGGYGIGMFTPVLIKGTSISVILKLDGNWERFTMHDIKNGNITHKRLGALMSFGRFAAPAFNNLCSGEINIKKSSISYLKTRKFKQCRVFYGYNTKPFIAELKYKDKTLDAELIPPSKSLNTLSWDIDGALDEITISFKGEDSPDIYAIALDGHSGIAVDNIPLRGSSGTEFTKTDLTFLRAMYQKINAKLIILEFGVNLVPHVVNDYSYYQKQFLKQLKTLKSLKPDLSIIVIGVSDMSKNQMGKYVSYPNIEKIRDAQKQAAFEAGCAFWDMYEAMGGKNSMPAWVYNNPPLARKDFTHFTWKGSSIIAKMFYESLMYDYHQFLKKQKNAQN